MLWDGGGGEGEKGGGEGGFKRGRYRMMKRAILGRFRPDSGGWRGVTQLR